MIPLKAAAAETLTSSHGETTQFQIELNAKAFNALMGNLYANPVGSVVREISTNAKDANPFKKFDIKLPGVFDPTFSVRDYGCSMSHDQVMNLYSTLFRSTKDNSNDATGMLGLGSKTPFAVVDQFNVTCWLNGTKRVYSVYLGNDGVPHIALVHSCDSDEPQGVEVSFAVKSEDHWKYRDEVKKQLIGFDPLPNVISDNFEWPDMTPNMKGDGWGNYPNARGGINIRQGSVLYPLDTNQINTTVSSWQMRNLNLIVDVPIGTVSFSTSREALSYDEPTVDFLNNRIAKVLEELRGQLITQLDAKDNYLDKCDFYDKLYEVFNALNLRPTGVNRFPIYEDTLECEIEGSKFSNPSYRRISSRRPSKVTVTQLRAANIYFQPQGLKKAGARIANLSHLGRVYWMRDEEQVQKLRDWGITVHDLSKVEPKVMPRAATTRRAAVRNPGMSCEFWQGLSYNKERQTFEPDKDRDFFIKPEEEYPHGQHHPQAVRAGLFDANTKVIILTESIARRLKFKPKMYVDERQRRLAQASKKYRLASLSWGKRTELDQMREFLRVYDALPNKRRDKVISDLVKDIRKYDKLVPNDLAALLPATDLPNIDDELTQLNLKGRLKERLPLWYNLKSVNPNYYLKLEGISK